MMIKDSVLIVQNRQLTNAVYNDILRFLMPILILAAIFHFPLFKGIGFFSAYTFSQILYGISLLLIINSIFQRKACCNPHSFSVIIKKGIIPTISALLVLSTAQFDRILLSLLMPSESLAIYFMAQNINTLITYATLSITAVITPILVNGYKEENREAISRITRRYSAYIFSFTFVIGLLSLIYGKQYFTLYNVTSNEGYIPLIVLIFSMAFSQLFGFGITLSTFNDRKKRLIVYQLVSLSIIIILDLVLVPKYQALGAAIGSATSTVAIRFMAWLDYKKTGYNVGII